MIRAEALTELEQQAGELSCLVNMAAKLAARADDARDMAALWELRALLGTVRLAANELHDAMGAAVQWEAA